MIDLAEAQAFVLDGCDPGPTVKVALADALGAWSWPPVIAGEAVPPFANTAMDGFAVRAVDTAGATDAAPTVLRVADTVRGRDVRCRHPGRAGRGGAHHDRCADAAGAPMPW